ncbi:hypothetical protein SmJEL517_g00907 [Synchytrium microbalum]|uniref:Translocation protein SEC66 n=1 Tax=Synchytrium microbalum TaxID=1806994 RepID=A0A507CHM9_9FUNG|nr:uncharacterized protein SmJEL517_g00907 [Synchytrium microbalum]TPX37103.1 hypothetical protein SmJEL517_g00907 [Synchytrium microbalum]
MSTSFIWVNIVPIGSLISFIIVVVAIISWSRSRPAKPPIRMPWFEPSNEKAAYEELVAKHAGDVEDPTTVKILGGALVRRAMADVKILTQMAQEKNSLHALVKTGAIGEDMWESFQVAEQEMQLELQEVLEEADTFKPGWSKTIFQEAQQILQQQMQKEHEENMKKQQAHMEAMGKAAAAQEEALKEEERQATLKELVENEEREKNNATNGLKQRSSKKK